MKFLKFSGKKDNLERLTKIFVSKMTVPFDAVMEFPEILVQWIAPELSKCKSQKQFPQFQFLTGLLC